MIGRVREWLGVGRRPAPVDVDEFVEADARLAEAQASSREADRRLRLLEARVAVRRREVRP